MPASNKITDVVFDKGAKTQCGHSIHSVARAGLNGASGCSLCQQVQDHGLGILHKSFDMFENVMCEVVWYVNSFSLLLVTEQCVWPCSGPEITPKVRAYKRS